MENATLQNYHPLLIHKKYLKGIFILFNVFLLIGFGLFIGYLLWGDDKNILQNAQQTQSFQDPTPKPTLNPKYPYGTQYTILSGCNGMECLFKNPSQSWEVEGYAKLQGYFHKDERKDWGGINVTCSSILVTGGSELLINSFKDQIEHGNSINKLDSNKNLLVNINLYKLDSQTKALIESSTVDNKIELGVIRITPEPREGSACEGFVEIISVKSLGK